MWPDREQSGNYKTHSCLLRLGLGLAKLDQTLLMSNILVPPPRATDPLLREQRRQIRAPQMCPKCPVAAWHVWCDTSPVTRDSVTRVTAAALDTRPGDPPDTAAHLWPAPPPATD